MSTMKWIGQSANDCIHTKQQYRHKQNEIKAGKIIDNKKGQIEQNRKQEQKNNPTNAVRQEAISKRPNLHWD